MNCYANMYPGDDDIILLGEAVNGYAYPAGCAYQKGYAYGYQQGNSVGYQKGYQQGYANGYRSTPNRCCRRSCGYGCC